MECLNAVAWSAGVDMYGSETRMGKEDLKRLEAFDRW